MFFIYKSNDLYKNYEEFILNVYKLLDTCFF